MFYLLKEPTINCKIRDCCKFTFTHFAIGRQTTEYAKTKDLLYGQKLLGTET
ncbi:hypothetical protein MUO79_03215 [Candidatus Bathyarchaeota archaeon]|nr:hypothetical protein [Candidatus Bathyarchaeota archaeon]